MARLTGRTRRRPIVRADTRVELRCDVSLYTHGVPIANVNGIDLFYECVGDGPTLLLIHGLGSSGDDWAFQRDDFARVRTLVMPDLRGSGRSAKPAGPYSIAQFASDFWALVDSLHIVELEILGFSLGWRGRHRNDVAKTDAREKTRSLQFAGELSNGYIQEMERGQDATRARSFAGLEAHS